MNVPIGDYYGKVTPALLSTPGRFYDVSECGVHGRIKGCRLGVGFRPVGLGMEYRKGSGLLGECKGWDGHIGERSMTRRDGVIIDSFHAADLSQALRF